MAQTTNRVDKTTQKTQTSLDKDEHLLNGTSFTFQYQTGGAMDISFANDKLSYTWIAGRNAGQPTETNSYKSRKLDTDIYFVSWHEEESKNHITFVFNFKNNTCAGSVFIKYNSEEPRSAFYAGIIEHVIQR